MKAKVAEAERQLKELLSTKYSQVRATATHPLLPRGSPLTLCSGCRPCSKCARCTNCMWS